LVRTGDQWIRCSFDNTFLDYDAGVVELEWTTTTADSTQPAPTIGAGLAFDNECRLYHSRPSDGRIERMLWRATDPLGVVADQPPPVNLIADAERVPLGDFTRIDPAAALREPRGLTVDVNDRLFVAETGGDRILVYDLWSDRLLRQVALPGARPTDLAVHGNDVYAVLAGGKRIVRLTARAGPEPFDLPAGCTEPSRVAVSSGGRLAILEKAGTPAARVSFGDSTFPSFPQAQATDIEWESESVLVVARQPGADFMRYTVGPGELVLRSRLRARGYDGLGIVATPDLGDRRDGPSAPARRIGYWTANGFRMAVAARTVFERLGRVTTFRLDSGTYQTVWGRLFLDACVPSGAALRVHYIALDEAEDETPMLRVPPANVQHVTVRRPDLSAPMPPLIATPVLGKVEQLMHLRESGRELPWTQIPSDDYFDTYEAPITTGPGRYLWVTLELRGNTRVSPKVRSLRAEYPTHDYVRRLPNTFSRDARAASFLRQYLAMFEGFLGETEARGVDRDLLLDPRSTPDECLPWLASFVGLVLDERWSTAPSLQRSSARGTVDVRRQMITEAVWLFRNRGTLPGLKRFIEIYTGVAVIIVEHYRMRGIGAAVVGDEGAAFSSSVVGVGLRIGGAIGTETAAPLDGRVDDAFRTHAHRFTVIIPSALTEEQLAVVRHIIDVHRPAHTLFDACTVGAGMRVGRGLLLEVSSVIGRTGGFSPFQTGNGAIGRGNTIGRPAEGGVLGTIRVGRDTRVG
jgi:phage tail-like protein